MRDVSDEMRNATSDLRRQDPAQASARGSKALEKLKELERQMQKAAPGAMDDQKRALGEMQLEARQLADAERQVSSELSKTRQGEPGNDQTRRLAGEQDRLADRVRRLQDGLKQRGSAGAANGDPKGRQSSKEAQAAAADAARELERQRLAERMQQSADAMRGGQDRGQQSGAQQQMARELDKLTDKLAAGATPRDAESRKMSDQLSRAQELRERIGSLGREIEKLGQQNGRNGRSTASSSAQQTPGQSGRTGEGQQSGAGGSGYDLSRLQNEAARQLQETRELVDELRRQDQNFARGGDGLTFEGQGMTLSAPGTEAFKQDFAKWEDLRRQATQALDKVESSLSKQLQDKAAKDRLAAGVDDKAPPEYRQQVNSYFKALASKKKP